jgi:hypothetical protein
MTNGHGAMVAPQFIQQEPVMSRTSLGKSLFVAIALGLSTLASTVIPASAFELSFGASLCPPGTHAGYEDKYCWPDRAPACPAGTHLGYEGKYCWPNH